MRYIHFFTEAQKTIFLENEDNSKIGNKRSSRIQIELSCVVKRRLGVPAVAELLEIFFENAPRKTLVITLDIIESSQLFDFFLPVLRIVPPGFAGELKTSQPKKIKYSKYQYLDISFVYLNLEDSEKERYKPAEDLGRIWGTLRLRAADDLEKNAWV